MSSQLRRKIILESLADGIPVIPDEAVDFYRHNCMICLHDQGHNSGIELAVTYQESKETFEISWSGHVTDQLIRAYKDKIRATDFGACAIALLLVRELTEFTAIEQASIGTTVDYYLISKKNDSDLIFNHAARLEVSGILRENVDNSVEDRIRKKKRRLKHEQDLRTYIAVVEFSAPWSKMVEV